jgi:lipopolysaccharide export LptBFGC system permease protein LptF
MVPEDSQIRNWTDQDIDLLREFFLFNSVILFLGIGAIFVGALQMLAASFSLLKPRPAEYRKMLFGSCVALMTASLIYFYHDISLLICPDSKLGWAPVWIISFVIGGTTFVGSAIALLIASNPEVSTH